MAMGANREISPRVYTNVLNSNGKRKRKYLPKVSSKRQEKKAREKYYNEYRIKINSRAKFSNYVTYWIEAHNFKSESTEVMYKMIIRKHLLPFFGNMAIGSIKKIEIEYFIKNMINKKYSKHYINLSLNILRKLFNDACKNGNISYSPTRAIESFRYEKKDVKIPDRNECNRIVEVLKSATKYKMPLLFGWFAGLRRGEALAVKWEDIDLRKNIITVQRQIVKEKGKIIVKPPKRNEIRTIMLLPQLKMELQKTPPEDRTGYIYSNPRSKDPNSFNYYYSKHVKPLIKINVFHNFRHIIITKMLALSGIPINAIKNFAGHSSVNITTQIYGQKAPEEISLLYDTLSKELS